MPAALSIAYLLEDTPLFGGVKVALRQANLMARRGHRVLVVSPGEKPSWMPMAGEFVRTRGLEPDEIPPADVTVATYWTTISRALAGAAGEVVHYCQGFEAAYTHNVAEHPAILESYSQHVPAFAVAPHLARMLEERFGRPARVLPQPLELFWSPKRATLPWSRPRSRPRILVTAPFEIDWKGVATALNAVRLLRDRGCDCELVRLSQWPLTDEERRIVEPDEFHEHLAPEAVPATMRSCDLMISASWEQEGFGLPVLEAMASGVPVIASDVSSYRDFAAPAARLVPFDRPEAFAAAAREVLQDPGQWRRMRRAGLAVARGFSEDRASREAEAALRWVASGDWRDECRR